MPVTLSIGVAEFPTHGDSAAAVIAAADAALYTAKQNGRNRVVGAPPPPVKQRGRKVGGSLHKETQQVHATRQTRQTRQTKKTKKSLVTGYAATRSQ